jgi:hypothetical protein
VTVIGMSVLELVLAPGKFALTDIFVLKPTSPRLPDGRNWVRWLANPPSENYL